MLAIRYWFSIALPPCNITTYTLSLTKYFPKALEVLLSTGADHTVQDLDGLTAADLAEECGHMFCADFIRGYEPPPLPDLMVYIHL